VLKQVTPVFAATYAGIFLKEPWYCTEFLSALCALVGVIFIARPAPFFVTDVVDTSNRPLGITFALLSAACAAAAYVIIRVLGTKVKVDWPVVMLYQTLALVIVSPLGMLVAPQQLVWLTPKQMSLALLFGLLSFGSQAAMTYGMQREKSATATVVGKALDPICCFLLQIIFQPGDPLFWSTFVGCAIILGGLVLTVVGKVMRSDATEVKSGPISRGGRVTVADTIGSNGTPSQSDDMGYKKLEDT